MPNPGKQQKSMPLNVLAAYLILGAVALTAIGAYIFAWVTDPYDTAGITGILAGLLVVIVGCPWAIVQLEDRNDN